MAVTSLFKRKKTSQSQGVAKKSTAPKKRSAQPSPTKKSGAVKERLAASRAGLVMLISEKAVMMQQQSTVVFRVGPQVSKGQVAAAIREVYGVTPLSVRLVTMMPKRRVRGRIFGWTPRWKKAYVRVPDLKNFNVTP